MSFADKKGIVVASGFKLQAETLLDVRQQVDTIQERDELVTIHAATPGLRVYVKNDKTSYVYNGTGWDKLTTGNAYVHPTGDGNHHVPATGTTNNGKVLMAGSTAGSESWQTLTTDDISDFPDSLPTPNNLVVKFNGGASEGTNQFTFNGSAAKTVNITPAAIGASALNHTHTHTSITDFDDAVGDLLPAELPNPEALTISLNGTSQGAYTGSAAKSINITPASIGAAASSHTHAGTQVTGLTANRAMISNGSGQLAVSAVTSTELGYLDGVTSAIQTQLNGKAASSHTHSYAGSASVGGPANSVQSSMSISLNGGDTEDTDLFTFDGSEDKTINITPASIGAATSGHTHAGTGVTGLTANRALVSNSSGQLVVSAVTSTELGYLDGVTSAIQTQLNNKAASNHTHNYAGSSSVGGPATSANQVNSDLVVRLNGGTTEGTNQFTFNGSGDKTINITPASIGAAAASHGTHVTYGTSAPLANGTASAGSAASVSRSDHRHPLQTTVSGNAGTATRLATARTIDGVSFNGSANITHFGTCSTAAATAAKVVSCTGFTLATGAIITVKFSATNTAANPTLNVNSTGAKAIMYRGSAISAGYLAANRVYTFVYDGTDYELIGDINTDTNTTYSTGTATKAGITKLYTGTGSNTDGTMTQSAITTALNGKANSSHTHTSANITDFEEAVGELLPTIPTKLPNPYTLTFTGAVSTTYDGSAARTVNIPTSGSTDADLIIRLNGGTTEGSNQFTFNGSAAKTVNITPAAIGAAALSHGTHVTYSTTAPLAAGTASAGSAATVARSDHRHPLQTTVSGNAGTATKLATARTISLTGDATGSTSFNGSANASIATTVYHHATTSITSNQDLNDFTDPGWYYCPANATAATLDNSPTTNAFTLIVTQHAGYNQLLIEYMTSAPRVFTRNYYNAWGSWYEIYHTGQKPTASEIGAAASSHNHSASNITSGTLGVARGGTGVTTNPSMLVNLASTSAASVFAASPRPGVTGALGIANGGTGATTASAARTALGAAASSHTHTGAQVTGLTASRALVSNSSGAVTVSTVTSTELGYLDGVTSAIQTQLNNKAASNHTHNYAGSSSAGGAATVANKINLPVGTTLFATSSSATFFSATLGGTWTVVGNIDTIVVSSGTALTLYLHRKTAS